MDKLVHGQFSTNIEFSGEIFSVDRDILYVFDKFEEKWTAGQAFVPVHRAARVYAIKYLKQSILWEHDVLDGMLADLKLGKLRAKGIRLKKLGDRFDQFEDIDADFWRDADWIDPANLFSPKIFHSAKNRISDHFTYEFIIINSINLYDNKSIFDFFSWRHHVWKKHNRKIFQHQDQLYKVMASRVRNSLSS